MKKKNEMKSNILIFNHPMADSASRVVVGVLGRMWVANAQEESGIQI